MRASTAPMRGFNHGFPMSSETPSASLLDEARRDIDAIDDQLLGLLKQRFDVTERVRQAKTSGGAQGLPVRPAREAQILRRLLAGARGGLVPAELLVRLWRGIINQSSVNQAPVTIHVSKHLGGNLAQRLKLRDHFAGIAVEEWKDEVQALTQINVQQGDICVVETTRPWAEAFLDGKAGEARVIASLPALANGEALPELLVLGQAPTWASGEDETLVITSGKLPRDFWPAPLWQASSGALRLAALPGFIEEHEGPIVGITRSNPALGLRIAGQYSRAIAP